MDIFDHLFLIALAVGLPVYELVFNGPKRLRAESQTAKQRLRIYRRLIVFELVIGGAVAALWIGHGRDWSELGFSAPLDGRFWWAVVASGLILVAIVAAQSMSLRRTDGVAKTREQIERAAPFAPRSARELRGFLLVALAAGVCEEIVYRGYVFWYGRELLGEGTTATIALVVLAAIVFMMAHTYQGKAGMPQVLLIGLVMGGLFVLGRSLWPLIILHIAMDAYGGTVALAVCGEDQSTNEPPDQSAR